MQPTPEIGGIYAIHASERPSSTAIALSSLAHGGARFVFLSEKGEATGGLPLSAGDLAAGGPANALVLTDTASHLPAAAIGEKLGQLTPAALDSIARACIRRSVLDYADQKFAPRPFVPGETPAPATGKLIDAAEITHMVDAALDGWLTTGRFNEQFETQLAAHLGVRHVLTVNSGSSANLIAFMTLTSPRLGARAIQPGDEVIGVAAAFPTTVNPILQFGAVPVFVDVNPHTYNIDPDQIEAAITAKTKAVMLAHTLGNPFDLEAVTRLCKKHGLWLIEDCCDALGSTYGGKPVGTFGDLASISFYPAHHITMGEGGALFTNNSELKQIAESFRDWGRDCFCQPGRDNTCGKRFCQQLGDLPYGYDHKYIYSHLGYNLKITDMQAACGLAQLGKLPRFVEQRKANFRFLRERLESVADFLLLPEATPGSDPAWFGFPLTLKEEANTPRVDLLRYLDQYKIGTRLLFAGNITRQPYMQDRTFRCVGTLPNTDKVMRDTFCIGVQPALEPAALEFIAEKLETFFNF